MFTSTPLALALLLTRDDPSDHHLTRLWQAYRRTHGATPDGFSALVSLVTNHDVDAGACENCDEASENDVRPRYHSHETIDGMSYCDECRSDLFTSCDSCGDTCDSDSVTYVSGEEYVCSSCLSRNYTSCSSCGEYERDEYVSSTANYGTVCESCLENGFSWCEDCDEYYHYDEDHSHGCDCEAPRRRFTFPANGQGTVPNDTRLSFSLPAGTVDDEGMTRIARLVADSTGLAYYEVSKVLDEVGPLWQGKRGNLTRRLSSALHKAHQTKLPPETISEVGNLARAHSSDSADWHVEFTRDLNLSADEFCHSASCWWQSYSTSRCCLKSWGGLAVRSYAYADSVSDNPGGRSWVQPVSADLTPTHDTDSPAGFIVYNGYGELDGYKAARIVAYLSGMTYRKISFDFVSDDGSTYTNGGSGFLVSSEAVCADTTSIHWDYLSHNTFDAHEETTP